MKRTSTYFPKPEEVTALWRVMDATGQTLGRMARDISVALQGKDKPAYTPHTLTGDYVVVLNAGRIRVTGRKMTQKLYYRHSGYVGNLKTFRLKDMMERHPERVIMLAVKGMLPAQLQMGKFLLEGETSIRDPETAAAWFEQAAQRGSLQASYYLGVIKRDFSKDNDSALYWFEQAASQGYTPAYFATARLYFDAPVSADTGMPSAEVLAKTYLWLSATAKRSMDSKELTEAAGMLKDIRKIMPETWIPDLDQKVSRHLSEYSN